MKEENYRRLRKISRVKIAVMIIPSIILVIFWVFSGIGKGYWGFELGFRHIGFNIDTGSVSFGYGESHIGDGTGLRSWFDPHKVTKRGVISPTNSSSEPDPFGDIEVPPPPSLLESFKGEFGFFRSDGNGYGWNTSVTVPFWILTIPTIVITIYLSVRVRNRRARHFIKLNAAQQTKN